MNRIFIFCLITLSSLSCKKEAEITPADTCQLAQLGSNDGTNDFTYDAAGKLTQWVATSTLQGGSKFTQTYVFTYDPTGRISTRVQTIAIDGKIQGKPGTTQYSYTNDRLTSARTVYELPNSTRVITTNYTYDSQQRISKGVSTETGFTQTSTYEYDSRGNCIHYVYISSDGVKDERIFTYDTSKNPEQLLAKSVPFNYQTGLPWSVNAVLTTKESFDDGTGAVTYTSKQTEVKTDASGYATSTTLTYNDGYVGKTTYSLINCQ